MNKTGLLTALAVSATLALSSSAHAALEAYMTLTGQKSGPIKGGVTQKGRENSIAVVAVSHEIVSPRDPQSGLPTGQRMHKPLVVTIEWDQSLPKLYDLLTHNENITSLTINFWKPQVKAASGVGSEVQFLTIALTNANIADIQAHVQNVLNPETAKYPETLDVAFTYQKIQWTWMDGNITSQDDLQTRASLPAEHPVQSASIKHPAHQPGSPASAKAAARHEHTRRFASTR